MGSLQNSTKIWNDNRIIVETRITVWLFLSNTRITITI